MLHVYAASLWVVLAAVVYAVFLRPEGKLYVARHQPLICCYSTSLPLCYYLDLKAEILLVFAASSRGAVSGRRQSWLFFSVSCPRPCACTIFSVRSSGSSALT